MPRRDGDEFYIESIDEHCKEWIFASETGEATKMTYSEACRVAAMIGGRVVAYK